MADTSTTETPKRKRAAATKPAKDNATPLAPAEATPETDDANWRDQAHEYAETARVKAGEFADSAKHRAGEFAETAKSSARDAATSAKNTTGDALAGLSKLISDTAETVDSKLGPQYGDYARKAAETLAGASKSLDEKDVDDLAEEARNFVRKSPAVTIGAAAVLGFVLMRMMRGSSSKDDA